MKTAIYKIRIILQIIFNLLFFLIFILPIPIGVGDFITKTQIFTLFPALSTFGYTIFILLFYILITIIFGRFYCSILCPLGAMQDLFININPKRKKLFPIYNTIVTNVFRLVVIIIFAVSIFFGFLWIAGMLDPYSIMARFFTNFIQSIISIIYNGVVSILNKLNIYILKPVMENPMSVWRILISIMIPLVVVIIAIFKSERSFCNSFCPVGAILSVLSRFSVFKISINKNSCVSCSLCEKSCSSYSIDSKNFFVDQSRCVRCLKCQSMCPKNALSFTTHTEEYSTARLSFFDKSLSVASGVIAALVIPDKLLNKKNYTTSESNFVKRSIPPGSISYKHLADYCIGCGRCVDICPSKTLRLDITNKPYLNYDEGSCEYECNKCGIVCPTGAIVKKSIEEKKLIAIGLVEFTKDFCVVVTKENDCGACAEHCPTTAVVMEVYKNNLYIPVTDTKLCVGCGSCERVCPVRPVRAIVVNSLKTHKIAFSPTTGKENDRSIEIENNDFNF